MIARIAVGGHTAALLSRQALPSAARRAAELLPLQLLCAEAAGPRFPPLLVRRIAWPNAMLTERACELLLPRFKPRLLASAARRCLCDGLHGREPC